MGEPLPRIKPCPRCGEHLWFYYGPDPSLIQWTFWTDGHNTSGFERDSACEIRRCSLCSEFFVEEGFSAAEEAAALEALMNMLNNQPPSAPIEVENAKGEAKRPCVEALYDGIAALMPKLKSDEEVALRIRAWRLENDRVRVLRGRVDHPLAAADIHFSAVAVDSMRRLFDLLDVSKERHRFYRAEIARELGAFEAADALFENGEFAELRSYAQQAQGLARKRDRYVANFR
jgi:hypothetical protein